MSFLAPCFDSLGIALLSIPPRSVTAWSSIVVNLESPPSVVRVYLSNPGVINLERDDGAVDGNQVSSLGI
jgi:hypothetical protein